MNHDSYPDEYLRDILTEVKTVAVVGASPRPHRPSHGVMRYLQQHGYRAIPVNPFAAGVIINGERCFASLSEVPHPRWSQASERVLGTDERRPTLMWNGYGEFVADMYKGLEKERLFA